jgi:hypothetical protein
MFSLPHHFTVSVTSSSSSKSSLVTKFSVSRMESVNIDGNGHVLDSTNDLAIRLATETLQSFFRLVVYK